MTDNFDYKQVLKNLQSVDGKPAHYIAATLAENWPEVKKALKIADRLKTGVISSEMIFEAKRLRDEIQDEDPDDGVRFRKMSKQLMKECE